MRLILVQPTLDYEASTSNVHAVRSVVEDELGRVGEDDILLLPEHVETSSSAAVYRDNVVGLARALGCHVVGGSQHEDRGGTAVNAGLAVAPDGAVLGAYEKLRPYADERHRVAPGTRLGELRIADRDVLVLVCADFWFSDLFERATRLPSLVLVPALSVTRKPTPSYSRALWRHLAVARAYEFGTYVGVSDWATTSRLPVLRASGVGGFADPTGVDPDAMYRPVTGSVTAFPLDFDELDAFRADRVARGFFWKKPGHDAR